MKRLGLLDTSPIGEKHAAHAVFDTVDLAVHADRLGFSRYWLGEHHDPFTAHGSPELLVPVIAGSTERIRVGAAGILVRLYAPIKIAKNFRLLEAMYGGRIDLGLAAGIATDPVAREAFLGERSDRDDYAERVVQLLNFLEDESRTVSPAVASPEIWVLGAGGRFSATLAGQCGAAFGLALFQPQSKHDASIIDVYRSAFRPSRSLREPRWNVSVAGFCASTESEARRDSEQRRGPALRSTIVGNAQQCIEHFHDLAGEFHTDEIIFLDLHTERDQRFASCDLLAQAGGLSAASIP